MFELEQLRAAFADDEQPGVQSSSDPRAAVASILRQRSTGEGGKSRLEVLFIERSRRLGDPWSGHMAFPGGRADPQDLDSRQTAERETLEEVGLDLGAAERLGRLKTLAGRRASGSRLRVAAHVYWLEGEDPELVLNHEVSDALWVAAEELVDPTRYVDYRYPALPFKTFPGVRVGERGLIVWGLTHRFLEDLFMRLGQSFPVRP